MRIKVNGIEDEKTQFSLKKVTDMFYYDAKFVDEHEDLDVTFSFESTNEHKMTVIAETGELKIRENRTIFNEMDVRYGILGAYYRLLSSVTRRTLPYGVLNGIRPTKLVHKYIKEGKTIEEVNEVLREHYYVTKEKADLLCEVAMNQLSMIPDLYDLEQEISVYINIPFCPSRCSYCSFTAFKIGHKHVNVSEYIQSLTQEIEALGRLITEQSLKVTTLYIGGGTPTSLSVTELEVVLASINKYIPFEAVREYTVEAGRPDSITEEKLILLKEYKVSRISINPQTFNNDTLNLIGRHHDTEAIYKTFRTARATGHEDINMDLIVGLPKENVKTVEHSLKETIKLQPESITVHTLALKKKSDLRKIYDLSTFERMNEITHMHEVVSDVLKKTAYKPYYMYRQKQILGNLENIGYAKEGFYSLYNIMIMEEAQTIIGLGCGSSSKFLTGKTILSPKDLKTYINTIDSYFEKKQLALFDSIQLIRGKSNE